MSVAAERASFDASPRGRFDGWRETLLVALAVIILPTIAYAGLAELFGFLGPRLNFDLFAIYIVSLLIAKRSRTLAVVFALLGVVVTLAVQILLGVGVIYLDNPALIGEYLSFAAYWPWKLISFWIALAAAVFAGFYFLVSRITIERARFAPVILVLAVLVVIDMIGRTPLGHGMVGGNLTTSSLRRGAQFAVKVATNPSFTAEPTTEPMMVDLATAGAPARILSVSVEALGVAQDNAAFNEAMFEPMRRELAGHYRVEIILHDYKGPTLSGEMRELCAQRTMGKPTRDDAFAIRDGCLPAILGEMGYASLGIHGNPKFFYNRMLVYPALGFQFTRFYEDYKAELQPGMLCRMRAFEGVCDRVTMRTALDFLAARPKAYAHVMTLDTHFPLGPNFLGDARCGRVEGLTNSDLCLYVNQMANLLAMFARDIRDAETPPDLVFLFGDHAPPYVTATERGFFDRERVPFITLRRIGSAPSAGKADVAASGG